MVQRWKRKAEFEDGRSGKKKHQDGRSQWTHHGQRDRGHGSGGRGNSTIEHGEAGIWATCDIGKEGKCVGELRDLLEEYADRLSGELQWKSEGAGADENASTTAPEIEAEIQDELRELRRPASQKLFDSVRIDVQCLVFFTVKPPVDPVVLVHRICEDASSCKGPRRTRFIRRLTPLSLIGRASEMSLTEVAAKVLAPHFHLQDGVSKKFAIRPSIRNHQQLKREAVIKTVAAVVGPGHKVDLKDYDLLILIDIYKNVCGISVVPGDYEKLKRYNLAELHQPTHRAEAAGADAAVTERSEAANMDDDEEDEAERQTRRPCTPPAKEPTPPVASPTGN